MVKQSKSHLITNGIKIVAFVVCAIYALTESETFMETAAANSTTSGTTIGLSLEFINPQYKRLVFVQDCHVCHPTRTGDCSHCTHMTLITRRPPRQELQNITSVSSVSGCFRSETTQLCQLYGNTCMEGVGCSNCMTEGQVEQSWYHNGQLGVMQCVDESRQTDVVVDTPQYHYPGCES